MVEEKDLAELLVHHSRISDRLLIILATFDHPCSINEIRSKGVEYGNRDLSKANIADRLNKLADKVTKLKAGWQITSLGINHLKSLGVEGSSKAGKVAASSLAKILEKVQDQDTRAFLEEAVLCCEANLFRSAVVMSWLAAVHVLRKHVYLSYRTEFDAEMARKIADWKSVKSIDDYGRIKEVEFLDRLAAISVIGKETKEKLKTCLRDRNSCGHPNSFKIGKHQVRSHIEFLILNIFQPFAK